MLKNLPEPLPGVPSRRRQPWSAQGIQTPQEYYTTHGVEYMAALLGRMPRAVYHYACQLQIPGIETNVRSEKETQQLIELYPILPMEEITRKLGQTFHSPHAHAVNVGLREYELREWTDDDDTKLKRQYGTMPVAEVTRIKDGECHDHPSRSFRCYNANGSALDTG